jgi:hypothetical protein
LLTKLNATIDCTPGHRVLGDIPNDKVLNQCVSRKVGGLTLPPSLFCPRYQTEHSNEQGLICSASLMVINFDPKKKLPRLPQYHN